MRYLTSSEARVKGYGKVSVELEKPIVQFQDVKVIVFPASKNDLLILNSTHAKIELSPSLFDPEILFDDKREEGVSLLAA